MSKSNQSYSEKLKDPRWQKKRLEILERDKWACRGCGDKTATLHVHHGYYERGKLPWEYDNWSLKTLCESCHDLITKSTAAAHLKMANLAPGEVDAAGVFANLLWLADSNDRLLACELLRLLADTGGNCAPTTALAAFCAHFSARRQTDYAELLTPAQADARRDEEDSSDGS